MLRKRHINSDPGGAVGRALSVVADLRFAVADRFFALTDRLPRPSLPAPLERGVWTVERSLLWPLQDRLAGWAPVGRGAGAGALAALAAAAVLTGVLLLPGESPRERVAAQTRVAIATPEPQPQRPAEPVLQGAAPDFGPGGIGASQADGNAADGAEADGDAAPAASGAGARAEDAAGATSSKRKPAPAGPAAMKVARRFTEAFVFYEIGRRPERAKTVFGETATPKLAEALGARPPRQPERSEVPKARVVNLVPGPRAGKAYTVSASLLRVGLTTELRLELSKLKGRWLVTDVRG